MLALSQVPFQGKENMTVQECVKFIGSFRVFSSDAQSAVSPDCPRSGSFCQWQCFGTEVLRLFSPLSPVSRTWRDRLLGTAAGAALTLATLWLILVSAATATVILYA